LEDKTLKKELKGYDEYSELVKYKLIPFIWWIQIIINNNNK
jgi:protein-S-isoprenylcysteine O-methyltransferase Ste14